MGSGEVFTIYEDEGGTEEEDNKESNKAKVKIAASVKTGSSGFFVFSPDNDHEGAIDSMIGGGGPIDPQSSFSGGSMEDNNDYMHCNKACIIGQNGLSLISYNCKRLSIPQEKVWTPWWSVLKVSWAVGKRRPIGFSRYL